MWGGIGIANKSSYGGVTDGVPGNLWTDVVFRGNRVERSGKNAMVIRNSKSPVVEYNTVAYSSRYETGNSIFNFDTIDCIMQYNESYGNTGGGLDEHERGGFDADWNSEGTIIQYNYSHDNYYFAAIMRKYNKGVTVRYNISQNELTGVFHYGFPSKDELTQCKIYNNTFYFKSTKGPKVFTLGEKSKDSKTPINTTLQNNIFYFSDSGGWGTTLPSSFSEDHNLFYNFASTNTIDKSDVQEDPKLENPGQGGTDIDMKASDRLVGYQLQLGSPAIDAGTEIQNNGGQDFWGHSLYYIAPDIGAYEYRQQGNENGHGNHNPDLVVKTFRANIGTSKDVLPVKYIWEIKNKSNQQFTCRIDFDGDGINDKVINPCPKNGSQLGLLRKGINKKKYKSRLTVTAGSSIGGSKISVIQVPARRIADIDAEDGYVMALKDNHSLVAWGDSTAGTLNIPTESLNGVTEISGGDSYAMALNADGTITTWGDPNMNLPMSLEDVVAISGGNDNAIALLHDGKVITWGNDESAGAAIPNSVDDPVAVSCAGHYYLVLNADGTVVAWGHDNHGQVSGLLPSLKDVVDIAAANRSSVALKSNRSIVAWGLNNYGQATAPDGSDYTNVAGGNRGSLALKEDGTVVAWGNDSHGEISGIPAGLQNVIGISAGKANFALKSDGTIVAWGKNNHGQTDIPAGLNLIGN